MPHSNPSRTSRTSSLKRRSVFSVPSWITTLSRSSRTLAPRRTQFRQCADDGFHGSMHVAFDDDRELFLLAGLDLAEHLFDRTSRRDGRLGRALLAFPELGDFARPGFRVQDDEIVAGRGCAV